MLETASCTVALVVVRHERPAGLRSIQRLNLDFFIDAQNNRLFGGFRYSPTIASNFSVNRLQCTDDEIAGLLRRQHREHRAPAQGPTVQRRDGAGES